jgi:hypothetical protein
MIIRSLNQIGTTPGTRAHNATIPLKVDDVILWAQVKDVPTSRINVGVYDNEYHISRLTWPYGLGTTLTLGVIRPATGMNFQTNVALDILPANKDIQFTGSNISPIPHIAIEVNLIR